MPQANVTKSVDRAELGEALRKGLAESQRETVEITEPEVKTPDPEDVSEEEEEIETSEEPKEEEEQEPEVNETEEEEVVEISTLTELASAIEVDPEFLYNIKIPMANGEEPISLSELKDKYTNLQRSNGEELAAIAEERTKFDEYKNAQVQFIQQQAQMPQEILAARAKVMAIANQYETFDWETLEKEDAGRAALEQQRLASLFQQAQGEVQQLESRYSGELQRQYQEHQAREGKSMLEKIPEWKDSELRSKEQGNIRAMLKVYGYSDQEISQLGDHRAMHMARDLMKLKQRSEKADTTVKKVTKAPKPLRSKSKPKPVTGRVKLAKAVERAKSTKRDHEKAREIGKLMRGEI